jgi:hypothetical protein
MEHWSESQVLDMTFWVLKLACMGFFAILFLQSGFDKVLDWKGNFSWLQGHFAKSPLRKMVPFLLGTLTVVEMSTGMLSVTGFLHVLVKRPDFSEFAFMAGVLALINLLMLFFGQRMAKDYVGAAGIVPYFVMAILSLGVQGLSMIF